MQIEKYLSNFLVILPSVQPMSTNPLVNVFESYLIIIIIKVRLMCALRAHINKSIFGKVLLGIEKVIKTFSILNKLFPKLVYYCVP